MLNKNGYVSKETVCAEIARFKGYLDEDMIYRLQLAINRLPDEITEVLPDDYDSFYRKMTDMEGR